jgi:hypothetical protein
VRQIPAAAIGLNVLAAMSLWGPGAGYTVNLSEIFAKTARQIETARLRRTHFGWCCFGINRN